MFKRTPTPLTKEQQRVYKIMLGRAHNSKNRIFTSRNLYEGVQTTLDTNSKRRLSRRFNYHAKKNPEKFEIISGRGNKRYRTKP